MFVGGALLASAGLLQLGWSDKAYENVQARLADGREPNAHHAGRVYTWRAGWINLLGLLALAAAGPLLARPLSKRPEDSRSALDPEAESPANKPGSFLASGWTVPARQARLAFVLIILAIMTVSAILNSSRLNLSLWGDEEFTARRFIIGVPQQQEDGSWQLEKPRWSHTVWGLGRMNNHFLFSIVSRLTYETLGPDPAEATGPRDPWLSEAIVRLPAFIAGLLALPAMAWCLRLWGIGRVATAAAVLLFALHPWYVRHAVDARGYAFVLLWIPLLMAAIRLALNHPSWPRWLLVGLLTYLMFHTYLGTVYLLAAIHGTLLLYWLAATIRRRQLPIGAGRWATGLTLSAMLGLQLVSPCLPAIQLVTQNPQFHGGLDKLWWQDAASFVAGGTPWKLYVPDHPQPAAMESLWQNHPVITGMAWLVLGFLALAGFLVLIAKARSGDRWLPLALAVGGPAMLGLHMWLGDVKPYHWYLVLYLPGLIFAIATGLDAFWNRGLPDGFKRIITVLLLLSMFWLGHDKNRQLRHYPYEGARDSTALARSVTNPLHPDYNKNEISVGFVMQTDFYDPGAIHVRNVEELRRLMAESDRTGHPLTVQYGSPGLARLVAPEIMQVLENPELFELIGVFPGHKDFTSREVRRYRTKPLRPEALPVIAGCLTPP